MVCLQRLTRRVQWRIVRALSDDNRAGRAARPRVFVTRHIPDAGLDRIRATCDVTLWDNPRPPPYQVLARGVAGYDGLLTLLTDRVDASLMEAAGPTLKVISNYAAGVDNVDVLAATARGIPVGHTPDVLTETTADLTWALILSASRRLIEAVRFVERGEWQTW